MPEKTSFEKARLEDVQIALKSDGALSNNSEEIICQFYGIDRSEMTVEEIAQHVGWTPGEVYMVIRRFHKRNNLVVA